MVSELRLQNHTVCCDVLAKKMNMIILLCKFENANYVCYSQLDTTLRFDGKLNNYQLSYIL